MQRILSKDPGAVRKLRRDRSSSPSRNGHRQVVLGRLAGKVAGLCTGW
jgi:hypothetical protein